MDEGIALWMNAWFRWHFNSAICFLMESFLNELNYCPHGDFELLHIGFGEVQEISCATHFVHLTASRGWTIADVVSGYMYLWAVHSILDFISYIPLSCLLLMSSNLPARDFRKSTHSYNHDRINMAVHLFVVALSLG